ncbi:MAG: hypothetical protein AB1679_27580 [Actinomycetota bacterium]|jgi:hypothetical protein
MASKRVLPGLILTLLVGAACGSAGDGAGHRLPPEVAAGLAARAEEVAVALEGGACDDALAKARSLQTDIAALPVEPAVQAEALAGAARLVQGISCPPPVVAPPSSAPVVSEPDDRSDKKDGKGKGDKGDKGDDDDD